MDFDELQKEMNTIIEDVKKAIDLPLDAEGKGGAHLNLEDLEKLLNRTQGVIDKLNSRATALAEKNGMSREEMAKFVEDPANFSAEEWQAMEAMKKQVDQFQKLLMKTVISQQEPGSKDGRRPASAAAKRNWIPL